MTRACCWHAADAIMDSVPCPGEDTLHRSLSIAWRHWSDLQDRTKRETGQYLDVEVLAIQDGAPRKLNQAELEFVGHFDKDPLQPRSPPN